MVIFFDIDGTIVDEASQIIPASTVEAISALRQAGHTPIINTGRPYSHLDPRVRAMPFAGWVCSGGMEVYVNGTWLQKLHMTREMSLQVIHAVRECRMQVIFEVEGGFLLDGELSSCPRVVHETAQMVKKGFSVWQTNEVSDPVIIKFVTFDGPDSRRAEFVARMETHFLCIDRGNGMMEFVQKGCSKAAGMERMLQHLGAAKEDTFAIGDSTNDVTMFRIAGHAICMGNGMEEAKHEAEYVTDTVLNDGIAKALRHYGLIR